jgi:hypothetical protein
MAKSDPPHVEGENNETNDCGEYLPIDRYLLVFSYTERRIRCHVARTVTERRPSRMGAYGTSSAINVRRAAITLWLGMTA